jgi:hypothetical protein
MRGRTSHIFVVEEFLLCKDIKIIPIEWQKSVLD